MARVATASSARIQALQLDHRRVWLKRPAPRSSALDFLQRALTRPLGRRALWLPQVEPGAVALRREARRLVHLRAQGFPVPEVLAACDDWLLLGDVGPSVRGMLRTGDAEAIADSLFDLLAELHAAGYWHGGAQARNFTRRDDGSYAMIDFEVGFPEGTPVHTLQARDLLLLVQSLVEYVGQPRLLQAIGRYVARCGSQAVRESAQHTAWLTARWCQLVPGGDARRARAAAALLRSAT